MTHTFQFEPQGSGGVSYLNSAQIGANNSKVHVIESLDRLELDNHSFVYQKVELVQANFQTTIGDRDRQLPPKRDLLRLQF